jgi:hypothetical protein
MTLIISDLLQPGLDSNQESARTDRHWSTLDIYFGTEYSQLSSSRHLLRQRCIYG